MIPALIKLLTLKDACYKHLKQIFTTATPQMTNPNEMLLFKIELTKLIKAERLSNYLIKHKAFKD